MLESEPDLRVSGFPAHDPEVKRIVVTGGTGGLGKALAAVFRDAGWQVEAPGSADLDLRDPQAVRAFFQDKEVDLLVYAAGITRDAPLSKVGEDDWSDILRVNYQAARECADCVIPRMAARGAGHVVFISSHSAIHPPVGQVAYASAKAALLGLTEDLAGRYGSSNVRINSILPGFLETPMTSGVSETRRNQVKADHHLGRFNTVDEVAAFVRFLDEKLPHTSGQMFQLDSRRSFL